MQSEDNYSTGLVNQLKNIVALFSGNGWKRRQNILLKEESEVHTSLNEIIQLVLNLSKVAEEAANDAKSLESLRQK